MSTTFDRVVTTILAGAAVISLGIIIRREYEPRSSNRPASRLPTYQAEWRDVVSSGVKFGAGSEPLQLVIFSDLECPFCRRYHESVLPRFLAAFPDSVGWTLVHYPLPMHRFARQAARAIECAAKLGLPVDKTVDVLYAKQDSFGLKPWSGYAAEAGAPSYSRFEDCIVSSEAFARIDSGLSLAARLGIRGTPGIMLNGWLFESPPAESALVSSARLLLANGNRIPKALNPTR